MFSTQYYRLCKYTCLQVCVHIAYIHTYIHTYIPTYIPTYIAEQTRDKINTNRKASSRADWTRENKGISLPVQPKGRRNMYMRPQRPNHGLSPIPL